MHWTGRWLGRPWVEGEHECTHFVCEVLREEFGRQVSLPRAPRSIRARDALVDSRRGLDAHPVEHPVDGDLVLMTAAVARRRRGYHLGVYAGAGEPHVLHCERDAGSMLHPIRELAALGLALEGYYRWAA